MKLFYIDSVYTFLITLILFPNEKKFYFLGSSINEKIVEQLDERDYYQIKKIYKGKNKYIKFIEKIFFSILLSKKIKTLDSKELYLQDHLNYSQTFLNDFKGKIYVLEDGTLNYNRKILKLESVLNKKKIIKNFFLKLLLRLEKVHKIYGLSEVVREIYLTGILQIPYEIKNKTKIIDIQKKWDNLSLQNKEDILKIFGIDLKEMNYNDNGILLLTQPLSEDEVLSEEEKINIYKEVLKCKTKKIYIKVHPREKTNYIKALAGYDIEIIKKEIPIEILALISVKFEEVITLFSTGALIFNKKSRVIWLGTKVNKKLLEKYGKV